MDDYIIIFEGPGGCDHSIRCGVDFDKVKADSFEDAFLKGVHQRYGWKDETGLESIVSDELLSNIVVYKVSGYNDKLFEEYHKRILKKIKEHDKRRDEEDEKAELERLKRKYES